MSQFLCVTRLRQLPISQLIWGALISLLQSMLRVTLGICLIWIMACTLALPAQADAQDMGQPTEHVSQDVGKHVAAQGGMVHDLSRSLHLAPPIPEERLKSEQLMNQGLDGMYQANYPEAIAALEAAIATDPTYDMPYMYLGDLYQTTGKTEQALHCYSQAIDLNPTFVRLYNSRGEMLLQNGQLEQAQSDFAHAIEVYPEDPQAYFNLGTLEFARGNYTTALNQLHQAIDRNPFFAEAYAQRGEVRLARGNPVGARFDYERAVQLLTSQAKPEKRDLVLTMIANLP